MKQLIEQWRRTLEEYDRDEPARVERRRKRKVGYDKETGEGSFVAGKKELDQLGHGITEKDKKSDCKSGNKRHGSDGKFSTVKDSRSWSGGYEDSNRSDCKAGKFKTKGTKKKLMTRHPCGKADDGTKEKFKCKDGQRAYQEESMDEDSERQERSYLLATIKLAIKDALKDQLNTGKGTCTLGQLTQALNSIALADKAKLNEPQKEMILPEGRKAKRAKSSIGKINKLNKLS